VVIPGGSGLRKGSMAELAGKVWIAIFGIIHHGRQTIITAAAAPTAIAHDLLEWVRLAVSETRDRMPCSNPLS
jgi:hypothetical protein